MKGKKSILFLLLVLLCLVVVGCGKTKEEEKEKEEKKASVQTLKCSNEEDGAKVTMIVEQDKKTYEFTSVVMEMSADASMYEDMEIDNDQLKELVCADYEDEYKSCDVKFENSTVSARFEFDLDKFKEETLEEEDIEKLDENTLTKLKESAEEGGYSCKIS